MAVDILLVNPIFLRDNPAERALNTPYFPLGLLYLAAFLRQQNINVDIFDGTFKDGLDDFHAVMEDKSPAAVGISVVLPNRKQAFQLADIAREFGSVVILGGPDPTHCPQDYLTHSQVDYVVHHEGELTLVELIRHVLNTQDRRQLSDIDGIAYRDENGRTHTNPRRGYILDLDQLPLPARDMIDLNQYLTFWRQHNGYASMTVSVARGCPFGCQWCQDSVHGSDLRIRSPENVVQEIKVLRDLYEFDRLRVVDDVDGLPRGWIKEWADIAQSENAQVPFEALNDLKSKDLPMLDVRDTL